MPSGESIPDTIAAVATPAGRGGIGIVRVAGPKVPEIARALIGGLPESRKAVLRSFRDAQGERVDEGVALYFQAPHSYTGDEVLELQGHGGPVVTHLVLGAVLDAGARLAGPGEFTRRAFLNGRLDLAQAEAVADLIDAASREAARSALRSLGGDFSAVIAGLVAGLTELRALTEAMLDFPDEEVDSLHRDDASRRLAQLRAALEEVLVKSRQGSLLRTGIHVVLAGRPNVGKSSLLNRLAGAERAIVTAVPGTTRDALRESIQIEGVPIVVVDTAGLRESQDEVEQLGMARTRQEMARADVVLVILEAGKLEAPQGPLPEAATKINVVNKVDLVPGAVAGRQGNEVYVSAKTGAGLEALRAAVLEAAGWSSRGETVFLARERHLRALATARTHLDAAVLQVAQWEFFAEELRLAQEALGEITGRLSADDLLGEIFARFCIGK
ncbi:MAG: tRNA uridine-5-carboxymethylaminomethyl(34) synthesis GTPase MnmE [Betaproteobacteria bacterium]|nr:tRNA uridine-5-carboxymethylaminomethyl(34) synthesis GTPase MnmE [Betaproteobacteria bacterium]MSQ87818.1 tRNA uridine-5-carboxymethylaminomethyl(34) synthesis GTPase MnmE [Betaproteobacteria bacterium]